jgi:DNA polymerase II large subunit
MTDKDMFERLGKTLYFLTKEADINVYDRWKEIGLTEKFADFIITTKNQIEAEKEKSNVLDEINRKALSEAFSKIHGSNWKDAFTCEVPEKDFKLYDDACVYHTGAMLQKVSVCDGIVQCYCDGYYHAMDGWT